MAPLRRDVGLACGASPKFVGARGLGIRRGCCRPVRARNNQYAEQTDREREVPHCLPPCTSVPVLWDGPHGRVLQQEDEATDLGATRWVNLWIIAPIRVRCKARTRTFLCECAAPDNQGEDLPLLTSTAAYFCLYEPSS